MASLLSKAAKDGDVDTVVMLMKENPGVVNKQHDGWTALHTAIVRNKVDVVKCMLENGADPDEENRFGMVPLVHAIDKNDYEIVRLLVEVGEANVMKFDGGMKTMAQRAKSRENTDQRIITLLEKKEEERKKEIEEEKAEKARKRKEAAAKRAAEQEAGGGAKKKGKKGKQPAKKSAAKDRDEEETADKDGEAGGDEDGGGPADAGEGGDGGGGGGGAAAAAAAAANIACSKIADVAGGGSLMFTEHSKWHGQNGFEPLKPSRPTGWGEGVDVAAALRAVLAGDGGPGGGCAMQSRVVKEGGIPEQHLFHPRFYKTGPHSWDNDRRSKVKFATNKLRALCKTNSVKHVQFANDMLSVVDPRQFVVGRLKRGGGLLVVSLCDDSEEHYHHGSF